MYCSALSAQLQIEAQADAWDVFMPYLKALPWLTLDGRGNLTGELKLSDGKLQHGSVLTLNSPTLRLAVNEQRLRNPVSTPALVDCRNPPPLHTAIGKAKSAWRLRRTAKLFNATICRNAG